MSTQPEYVTPREYITRQEFEELKGSIRESLGVVFQALDKMTQLQAITSGSVNNLVDVQERQLGKISRLEAITSGYESNFVELQEKQGDLAQQNAELLREVRGGFEDVLLRLEPPEERRRR